MSIVKVLHHMMQTPHASDVSCVKVQYHLGLIHTGVWCGRLYFLHIIQLMVENWYIYCNICPPLLHDLGSILTCASHVDCETSP